MKKNDKKTINAWCMYDWANSVYSLTITTAVFPSYFFEITGGKESKISFLGSEIGNTVLYSYALSAAFLIVAFLNPLLSGIADYSGKKLSFMKFFVYLGSISCTGLFFFDGQNVEFGMTLFILAAIGFAGSLVFYNSFLPEITTEDQFDKVSARGFALGYIGSVLLLIINLLTILKPSLFLIPTNEMGVALDSTLAPRISFLTVGLWWAGFSQVSFIRLSKIVAPINTKENVFFKGYSELIKVWNEVKLSPNIKAFLRSFFLYSMGVQTVMYLATIYGEEVVGMKMPELIGLVLILQLLAIAGAYFFSYLSSKKGNIFSITVSLVVWILVCISAFFISEGMKMEFYIIGIFVGLVMGGVQSMSRSTYSKLIPEHTEDHASYFSYFETLEKIAIGLGAMIYGVIRWLTGEMNYSALFLAIFFIIGIGLLQKVQIKFNPINR